MCWLRSPWGQAAGIGIPHKIFQYSGIYIWIFQYDCEVYNVCRCYFPLSLKHSSCNVFSALHLTISGWPGSVRLDLAIVTAHFHGPLRSGSNKKWYLLIQLCPSRHYIQYTNKLLEKILSANKKRLGCWQFTCYFNHDLLSKINNPGANRLKCGRNRLCIFILKNQGRLYKWN